MMNQNDYHPAGMKGYNQPNSYFPNTTKQQNAAAGPEHAFAPGAQSPDPYDRFRNAAPQGNAFQPYQAVKGYTTPQVAFTQGSDNYYQSQQQFPYNAVPPSVNNPYPAASGYPPPPQQSNTGSFIPQTPYSPGYTSPGYQPPQQGYPGGQQQGYPGPQQGYPGPQQGYQMQQPGYSPYGQMGRTQPNPQTEYNPSIPLNGGGYVPQKVPVRRKPFVMKDIYLILMGLLLAALFAAAVIITGNPVLKILLIILAAGSAGVLWIKRLVADNKRLTYSILALALCLLTAVSFVIRQPNDLTTSRESAGGQQSAGTGISQETVSEAVSAGQASQPESEEQPESKENIMFDRLYAFFSNWNANRQDEMLALCSPNWINKQENPRTSLFILLGNRKPRDCTIEGVTGTEADNSRKVTLTSKIDRNDGRPIELYRMTVLMVKENNEWFIDPQSLKSYDNAQTTDPNITPTPAPTEEPAVYSNTMLYYNPNGGEYYHFVPDCRNVGKKNIPLQGQFTYAEVNDEPYSKLKPCNVCGAPLRP